MYSEERPTSEADVVNAIVELSIANRLPMCLYCWADSVDPLFGARTPEVRLLNQGLRHLMQADLILGIHVSINLAPLPITELTLMQPYHCRTGEVLRKRKPHTDSSCFDLGEVPTPNNTHNSGNELQWKSKRSRSGDRVALRADP